MWIGSFIKAIEHMRRFLGIVNCSRIGSVGIFLDCIELLCFLDYREGGEYIMDECINKLNVNYDSGEEYESEETLYF